jgi:hypothetical protein
MGTTAAQKKLFFNLRRMKNQIEVRAFEKLQASLLRLAGERRLLPAA